MSRSRMSLIKLKWPIRSTIPEFGCIVRRPTIVKNTLDQHFRSIALIQEVGDGPAQWLLRWDPKWNQWRFIVGERLNRESFRETTQREVGWQLNLDPKSDFLVSNMAQLSMEYVDVDPKTNQPRRQEPSSILVSLNR